MKGLNSVLAAIGLMFLVFIVITAGKVTHQASVGNQVTSRQLAIEEVMVENAAINQVVTEEATSERVATEEVIDEEVGAKCAPGWVASKDGIFCSPAIFRQLDMARQSDNKCWEGGMLLRCRE